MSQPCLSTTPNPIRIGLIGDRDASVTAHRAIPRALDLAAGALGARLEFEWLPTTELHDASGLVAFDALWCVPATPYRNADGALLAIRFARERAVPFLGTCGGFQHAVIEYARGVLGWTDADNAETAPDAARPVIAPLACSMVEVTGPVRLLPGSRIATAYGREWTTEGYHCRYGLNPRFLSALTGGTLRVSALDDQGDVRALELDGHPFFVMTLFQPERAALEGSVPPIVRAFVHAAMARAKAPIAPAAGAGARSPAALR